MTGGFRVQLRCQCGEGGREGGREVGSKVRAVAEPVAVTLWVIIKTLTLALSEK